MNASLIYPQRIAIEGHPSQHGIADLHLSLGSNRPDSDIHVVLTCDQLLALYRSIAAKISTLPIHLVSEEVSQ
ncbi:hypothetical protein [Mycolicibacterium brisbanense]|uniref:GTP cyclohydrolase II n=1 Tax=Mycolicibacterium brisbanense TaxID=146020 RepID=A0A117I5Q7_9MYCO|nr:hypothetical protein [Mycolicibacterium brisbanense]MCV7156133.1 hypothetical protein [Mycolicibacterium brisbanense]GAS88890.1 GTP cyclohydrolase II [Mycolicibacterium brisbanense]